MTKRLVGGRAEIGARIMVRRCSPASFLWLAFTTSSSVTAGEGTDHTGFRTYVGILQLQL